jgi:hypothetical protein
LAIRLAAQPQLELICLLRARENPCLLGTFPVMGMSFRHKVEPSFALLALSFIYFYEISAVAAASYFFSYMCDLFLIVCFVVVDSLFIYLVILSLLPLILG